MIQVKNSRTPSVFNSKAQGKPKRLQPRGATLGRRNRKISFVPQRGSTSSWRVSCTCETPLGFNFFFFVFYPGCAGVPATAGLWNV